MRKRIKNLKEEVAGDFVNPIDFFGSQDDAPEQPQPAKKTGGTSRSRARGQRKAEKGKPAESTGKQKKAIFITGTSTDIGKTVATCVLGILARDRGLDVGVMKPVQCGGGDSKMLMKALQIKDSLADVNPYYFKESVSPHIAFQKKKVVFGKQKIISSFHKLRDSHDILLVEGAGGLLVPIAEDYLMADLIKDLGLDVVVVSSLGLGAINHALLTISHAREKGLDVRGILFNEKTKEVQGVPEKTNPQSIQKLSGVQVLGTIPFLPQLKTSEVKKQCHSLINIRLLLEGDGSREALPLELWDKKYVWHPFTQMKDWLEDNPLVIDQAQGSYLIDTQGKKYLDGISSLWVNVHGHSKPEIVRAIKAQVNKLQHSTLLGLANSPSIELAKRLIDISPSNLEKVFFSDNGSTAVEIAIKMAYQYWQNVGKKQKVKIAHLSHSYHGDTLGSVSVGGIDLFHEVYQHLVFKSIKIDFPDCYRAPEGKKYPEYAFDCIGKFETMLRRSHRNIAALVVEPIVQGAAGMIVWPEGVLRRLAEVCREYNIFLIADEVATGFGRTGKMFACEHENVKPDFLCLAKGLTGGALPLAATLTTKKVFDGFLFDYKDQKTFFHGHTYTGNPICCAAALANLDIFAKEDTLKKLEPKIDLLTARLKNFYKLQQVGDVRQKGFMVGIELVKDKTTKEPYPWEEQVGVAVCRKAREQGVILRPLGNVIVVMPPLVISEQELDYLLKVVYWSIQQVTEPKTEKRRASPRRK